MTEKLGTQFRFDHSNPRVLETPIDINFIGKEFVHKFAEGGVTNEQLETEYAPQLNARIQELMAEQSLEAPTDELIQQVTEEIIVPLTLDIRILWETIFERLYQVEQRLNSLENPGDGF